MSHKVASIKKSSLSVELVVVWASSSEVVFFYCCRKKLLQRMSIAINNVDSAVAINYTVSKKKQTTMFL